MAMLGPGGPGDIVDQRELRIEPDDTCAAVYEKVAADAGQMLREHLPGLLAGTAPRRQQQADPIARILPARTPEMGITSFDRSAREVHDWIRALTRPDAGAFAYLRKEKVVLWRAELLREERTPVPPGTVLGVDHGGVVVVARTGAVRLREVQAPGWDRLPAALWFARRGLQPGCVFDPVQRETLAWALGRTSSPGLLVHEDARAGPAGPETGG
jgi:methionyl-tRNA formyltransferase